MHVLGRCRGDKCVLSIQTTQRVMQQYILFLPKCFARCNNQRHSRWQNLPGLCFHRTSQITLFIFGYLDATPKDTLKIPDRFNLIIRIVDQSRLQLCFTLVFFIYKQILSIGKYLDRMKCERLEIAQKFVGIMLAF